MPEVVPERRAPASRERQRLDTRERLFRAAVAEFRRAGFAAAQIDRIVEAAGVARGTFYFHFPTREHVLLELQRRREARIVRRLARRPQPPASIRELLGRVVHEILAEEADLGDPRLAREILSMYVRQPMQLDWQREPLLGALGREFAAAAERGEVRADLPPETLTGMFLTTLFGFFLGVAVPPAERRASFERVTDVFLRGIQP